jgi:hypothetical protein
MAARKTQGLRTRRPSSRRAGMLAASALTMLGTGGVAQANPGENQATASEGEVGAGGEVQAPSQGWTDAGSAPPADAVSASPAAPAETPGDPAEAPAPAPESPPAATTPDSAAPSTGFGEAAAPEPTPSTSTAGTGQQRSAASEDGAGRSGSAEPSSDGAGTVGTDTQGPAPGEATASSGGVTDTAPDEGSTSTWSYVYEGSEAEASTRAERPVRLRVRGFPRADSELTTILVGSVLCRVFDQPGERPGGHGDSKGHGHDWEGHGDEDEDEDGHGHGGGKDHDDEDEDDDGHGGGGKDHDDEDDDGHTGGGKDHDNDNGQTGGGKGDTGGETKTDTGVTVDSEVKPEGGVKPESIGDTQDLVENRTGGQRLTGAPEETDRGAKGQVEGRSETTSGGAPQNEGDAGVHGAESDSGAVPVSYTNDTGSSADSGDALPFTGLPVAALAALGAAMLLTGVGLRRRAR